MLNDGFLCVKLGLPNDIEPEFLDLKDSIEIFDGYLEALPSFILVYYKLNLFIIWLAAKSKLMISDPTKAHKTYQKPSPKQIFP